MKIVSAQFVKGITGDDNILYNGIAQIAFVGRSNVGKSSIISSLMEGKAVARVGKVSGKTLEINFFNINDKYYFVDLPGYGYAQKGLDQREMIRSMIIGYLTNKNFQPRTVAVVLDSKAGLTDFDREVLDILSDNNHHAKIIVTKTDKVTQKELSQLVSSIHKECEGIEILQYSSVNERGKEKLLEKLIG